MDKSARDSAFAVIREKRNALLRDRKAIQDQRDELESRDRQIDRELADCVAAARVFGVELELPLKRGEAATLFSPAEPSRIRTARLDPTVAIDPQTGRFSLPPMPKIKDVVLDRLKSAGDAGARSGAIRNYIINTYGSEIHEKTVGMTLYRLLRQGVVHRKGITWFFGPAQPETKNPGAGTPGPLEKDAKKGG